MVDDKLIAITREALDRGVVLLAILAVPVVVASVSRSGVTGWLPVYSLQLTLLVLVVAVALRRRRLSATRLAVFLVALCAVAAVVGLLQFGWVAPAAHWFAAVAAFIAGMQFERRGRLVFFAVLCLLYLAISGLFIGGVLTPAIPPSDYALLPSSWSIELLCAGLFLLLALPTVKAYIESTEHLVGIETSLRNRIKHLADHDHLTGLPAYRVGADRLAQACASAARTGNKVGLLFVDLDNFKPINDRHGHEAGDACLVAIARRLSARLRDTDTASRLGGDEFIVVLDQVADKESAARLAQELVALIEKPICYGDLEFTISASIGIAIYPGDGTSPETLRRAADQAMYRAKREPGRQVCHAEDTETAPPPRVQTPRGAAAEPPVTYDLDSIRSAVLNRALLLMGYMLAVALVIGVWRVSVHGVRPNTTAMLLATVIVWTSWLLRRRMSPTFLSLIVCGVGLLIAFPGLYRVGMAAPGVGWCLATSLFLSAVLLRRRVYLSIAALSTIAIASAGFGHMSGRLIPAIAIERDFMHPSSWGMYLLGFTACSWVILITWSVFRTMTRRLLQAIDEERQALDKAATTDSLTGLYLLRVAMDRLELSIRRAARGGTRTAALFLDLDGFKTVNDRFGHDAGDYCLREIAARLRDSLHDEDTAARIGGDEFLIIVNRISGAKEAEHLAARLISRIDQPMEYTGQRFGITTSIGIGLYPDHGGNSQILRQQADSALYAAKRAGKNRYALASFPAAS